MQKKTVDLYIVNGDENTYTKLPAIKEQRERKVIVEYERQNNDYDAGTSLHGIVDLEIRLPSIFKK